MWPMAFAAPNASGAQQWCTALDGCARMEVFIARPAAWGSSLIFLFRLSPQQRRFIFSPLSFFSVSCPWLSYFIFSLLASVFSLLCFRDNIPPIWPPHTFLSPIAAPPFTPIFRFWLPWSVTFGQTSSCDGSGLALYNSWRCKMQL